MAESIYVRLKERFADICREHGLMDENIQIQARVLSTHEAIGHPEADDFPLQKGKERLMQADFFDAAGQAFSDRCGDFSGPLRDIVAMSLTNNYRRAIFVAALNAVMRHLKKASRTIHCRNEEPAECAGELVTYIRKQYGNVRIMQAGFQPEMVAQLSAGFDYRIVDLDPDNIGTTKRGALVEGPEAMADAMAWANLLLVTGTTLVNGTIEKFFNSTPVLFYGTTIAGAAELMGWDRFCAKSR
ncbi:MAG: DUF364 domain-containing protein [Thermodesulfobacteriota bacterium]|nr:DUF364 domain-containing protein [Thermodesulfobacteriota bacterium]